MIFDYPISYIGILLIVVGIIFLYDTTNINIKIGTSLILIGYLFIMFYLVNENANTHILTGKNIFFIFSIWISFIFVIFYNMDADIYLIVVIIGIITVREFLIKYIPTYLKKRMDIIFYLLVIIFIIIIAPRILKNIINI